MTVSPGGRLPAALGAAWDDAWRTLGIAPAPTLLGELVARYTEPHRAYHTLQHLSECFVELGHAVGLAEHPAAVALALWFHDAIYDTRAHDNEARSGAWARTALLSAGGAGEIAARVEALVLATRHDVPPDGADARLVVDVDLAILGAEPPRFAEYEAQIRREYRWVPDDEFRQRRARVLGGFLTRPAIYSTAAFVDRLEARARANLARSLAAAGDARR
jgi:predicted metal-dependent HD superfamily phosphohydrolase